MCYVLQGVQVSGMFLECRDTLIDMAYVRYQLVEKHLIEFSQVAMQRQDFKKTDDMFNRVLGKDHMAVVTLLENKETGTRIIIANAHIHWDPQYRDVKLVQAALLVEEVEKIAQNFAKYPPRLPPTPSSAGSATAPSAGENNASSRPPPIYSDGYKIPVIVCGDFNSIPQSGVYEFLSTGAIPPNHEDFMHHTYGRYTTEGLRHRLQLKSAYAAAGELPMTNYTPSFKGAIDYIWYSTPNLSVNSVLGEVDQGYLDKVVGFPNAHFPSEYVVTSYVCRELALMVLCWCCVMLVTCVSERTSACALHEKRSPPVHHRCSPSPRACIRRVSSDIAPTLPLSLSHRYPATPPFVHTLSCKYYFSSHSAARRRSDGRTFLNPSFTVGGTTARRLFVLMLFLARCSCHLLRTFVCLGSAVMFVVVIVLFLYILRRVCSDSSHCHLTIPSPSHSPSASPVIPPLPLPLPLSRLPYLPILIPLSSVSVRLLAFSCWYLHTLSRSTTLQNCSMCVYGSLVQYKDPFKPQPLPCLDPAHLTSRMQPNIRLVKHG